MTSDSHAFDLVGVGFGPSGIALASAIEDRAESRGGDAGLGRVCFLEKSSDSAWHRDMLLAETDIQHHFFRDLATPRDPRSRFTFANYLKEKGRIYEFGELALGAAGGAVSRLEWSDYLMWAAGQLHDYVRYDHELLEIRPSGAGPVDQLDLVTAAGVLTTKALVLCHGRAPQVPVEFQGLLGSTVFHSSRFRGSISGLDRDRPWRFAVVGSGESAIEILTVLHSSFPRAQLVSIHRSLGFKHVDLCQFSNEIFHPRHVDFFHSLEPHRRRAILHEARPTNFGVVDAQASDILYRKLYEDMVTSVRRFELVTGTCITAVDDTGGAYRLDLENIHSGARSQLDADFVILGTGYREEVLPAALAPLAGVIETDDEGDPIVSRDYRVSTVADFRVPVYLSGMSERTHGASDSASFSLMALRAERVLDSLLERTPAAT